MSERSRFSAAEQAIIARIEKTGAALEKNRRGWGFVNAGDKALKLIKGISGLQFLDLFEACDEGDVSDEGLAHIRGLTELRYLRSAPGSRTRDWRIGRAHRVARTAPGQCPRRHRCWASASHQAQQAAKPSLQYTDVAGAGLDHLAGLKKLKELNLDGTPVTKEAVAAIQKALPKCKILWDRPKKATAAKSTRKLKNASAETAPAAECGLTLRATLRGHANKAGDAAFSADGAMLVSIAFNKVLLWDGATGAKLRPMELKQGSLWGAAFTPDGKLFASGSNGSCVFLWDTASGKQKMCLETPNSVFTALDIDAGGNRLAAGGQDSKVYLWELPGGKLLGAFRPRPAISSARSSSARMAKRWQPAAASRSFPFGAFPTGKKSGNCKARHTRTST